jgi:hypothetical protein
MCIPLTYYVLLTSNLYPKSNLESYPTHLEPSGYISVHRLSLDHSPSFIIRIRFFQQAMHVNSSLGLLRLQLVFVSSSVGRSARSLASTIWSEAGTTTGLGDGR